MQKFITLLLLFLVLETHAQSPAEDSAKQHYLAALKQTGKFFSDEFYSNYAKYYTLPEDAFIRVIDSARLVFLNVLHPYSGKIPGAFFHQQEKEIDYYFDKLLIDYPVNHANYTGTHNELSSRIPSLLKKNLADFNKPELLENSDFINYVKSFLAYETYRELTKNFHRIKDNRELLATWKLLPAYFQNINCREFWETEILYNHIDNNGISNIEPVYRRFKTTCTNSRLLEKVVSIYTEDSIGRQGHLIRTYKTIGSVRLVLHLFLPGNDSAKGPRPAIVYFHGGSWTEGKPDWFFDACKNYAAKGWVACAVEYRTSARHGTLPFQAVMDAKSAIRWLRQNASELRIDTSRIVASGNSAGGHLVLCTALADKWNDKTDNLRISPVPNVLLINAGVYDLTDNGTSWIRKDLRNKETVKEISPNYLVRKTLPPTLILHGTNDGNVPFASASSFVKAMKNAGNNSIQFEALKGAGHFIWYDPRFSPDVSRLRTDFLTRLGF